MFLSSHNQESNQHSYRLSTKSLIKIQVLSGAIFSIFLLLHLGNTLSSIFGYEVYNKYQEIAQWYYQNPAVEFPLVIFPLLAHSSVGVLLFIRRRKSKKQQRTLAQKIHSLMGLILLFVVFGHIAATRGISLYANTNVGFGGIAFTFKWMPLYFYPYYFILFMAGFYHAINGLSLIFKKIGLPSLNENKRLRKTIFSLASIMVIVSLL